MLLLFTTVCSRIEEGELKEWGEKLRGEKERVYVVCYLGSTNGIRIGGMLGFSKSHAAHMIIFGRNIYGQWRNLFMVVVNKAKSETW